MIRPWNTQSWFTRRRTAASGLRFPTLSGCYSQGETIDETLHNTKEAIESYLMALREDLVAAPIEESLFIGKVRVEVAGL